VLHSEEFRDQPPAEVYHRLLERGTHLCSLSTMHRILREDDENGDRRDQRAAKHHAVPRLLAEAPNAVWTWDCSKLATRARGVYLTLYVVLDLFSRFVLAWMVSRKENSALARQLMNEAAIRYRIGSGQLTVHQDRGAPMIAHRYIDQMTELGIVLSHSRPRVSNDNAFREAQFKTQKHQPDCPGQFANTTHARAWCSEYFDWYNFTHHHSALAGFTPEQGKRPF
jgi:putative transposase